MHGLGWDGRAVQRDRWTPQLAHAREHGAAAASATFNFVQISDSHIGFHKPANPDVAATFRETIARINALPQAPDFILHTAISRNFLKRKEFDDLQQMLTACKDEAGLFCSWRTRRPERQWGAISGALRKGHARQRLVQLRLQGRTFRRAGQRHDREKKAAWEFSARNN
jgi:hypothetical protein